MRDQEAGVESRRAKRAAAALFVAAAIAIQFRHAPRTLHPDWSSVTGDYQQYLPVQMATDNPALFRSDPFVQRLRPLYPRAWRHATAFLGIRMLHDPVLFNWLSAVMTLATVIGGVLALAWTTGAGGIQAACAALLLLAGKTDPFNHYFVTLGSAAAPREQALALFPWVLFFMARRASGRRLLPWEVLLAGIAAHAHAATALYETFAIGVSWVLVPQTRPDRNRRSMIVAAVGSGIFGLGLLELWATLSTITPPARDVAAAIQSHYWPLSRHPDRWLRALSTSAWVGRPLATLLGFLVFARLSLRTDPVSRLLYLTGGALACVSLLWAIVPFTPLGMTFFTLGQRAYFPAIIPLAVLGAKGFASAEEPRTNRPRWPWILGGALLLRSLDLSFLPITAFEPVRAEAVADLARFTRATTPLDAVILIPTELSSFRWLSERACIGDVRIYSGVAVLDESIRTRFGAVFRDLLGGYDREDLESLLRIGRDVHADFAVVPAAWSLPPTRPLYGNSLFALVRLSGQ